MNKYNPMETAPKDGTEILVWNYETYLISEPFGKWMKVAWLHNKESGKYSRYEWAVPESWQDEQGGYETANSPICWTSLPEPPEGYS